MLIVDIPGILSGVIRHSLDGRDDLVVVGELADVADMRPAIAATAADIVVLDVEKLECGVGWPAVALLALTADGRDAWSVRPLGELSPDAVADAIRSAVTTA